MGVRRHGTAVGVGQRYLAFAAAIELRQHVPAARSPVADRRNLLG
jgi:hypothetical protein